MKTVKPVTAVIKNGPKLASVSVGLLWLLLFLSAGRTAAQQKFFSYDGTTLYNKRSENGITGYSNPRKVLPIPPAVDGQNPTKISSAAEEGIPPEAPSAMPSSPGKTRLFSQTTAPGSYDDPLNGTAGYGSGYHLYGFNVDAEYGPPGIRQWSEPAVGSLLGEPTDARESFFQGACGSIGYIPNTGAERSGQTTADASVTFLFPLPDDDHLFLASPKFGWTGFNFPVENIPVLGESVNLYSAGGDLRYLGSFNEDLLLNLGLGISWNSDFSADGSKALRLTGEVSAEVELDNTRRLIFGAMYTGLSGVEILPVAGLQLRPNEDIRADLYFPRPKIAKRFSTLSSKIDSSYWGYISGELDGGRWVFRSDPQRGEYRDYKMNYHDWRILFGMERIHHREINWALEGGLVLGRKLTIEGLDTPFDESISPKTSAVFRLKLWY